jgi:hypothetical protein
MTGHLRIGFAALLLAGFSTSPAAANPLADLFSINATPPKVSTPASSEASAPASPEEKCLSQPGRSTAAGQHWFYRLQDHRKCWYQAAEGSVKARKRVHHRVAKRRAGVSEEREAALHKRKSVMNAHAELLRSAPVQKVQPVPPEPDLKVADAAVVPVTGAAALVPPAPVLAKPALDQPTLDQFTPDQDTPDQPAPRHVNVERLLADAPAAVPVASAPPATPVAFPARQVSEGHGGTTTWLGVLLMTLGFVLLLGSSRVFRRPLLGQ